jgi:hypothetical protein
VLIVTRLDRLARSTRDLLNILDVVGKAGAAFKSLGDAWANTTTPHGRLMLTVLGGLAEFERELTVRRLRGNGLSSAPSYGVRQLRTKDCPHAPNLGMVIGASLTIGGPYITDAMTAAEVKPLVNWEVVVKNIDG